MNEVKKWLEENYPKENRKEIKELNIEKKSLEGELDLSDFPNLKKLICGSNQLVSLNVENCPNLEVIDAWNNLIEKVIGFEKLIHLRELDLAENKLKKLDLTHNVELINLIVQDNPDLREVKIGEVRRLIRYNGGSFPNPEQFVVLSWAEIIRKNLDEIAGKLEISSKQTEDLSVREMKEVMGEIIDELRGSKHNREGQLDKIRSLKDKVRQAEDFGLTEWDNLGNQTKNETLTSLLNRPTRDELEKAEKERDQGRKFLNIDDLNKLPQVPENETLQTLLDRPTKEQLEKAVSDANQQKDNEYKDYINPTDEGKLKEAAEKAGFGFEQQDIDNAVKGEQEKWKGFIDPDNLKQEAKKAGWEYNQADLDQAVNNEKNKYTRWVDPVIYRTDWIDPNELEKKTKEKGMFSKQEYNKVVGEKNARPNITLEEWNNDYSQRPKKSDLDKVQSELDKSRDDLKEWTNQFGSKSPEDVKKELDDLRSKPTGSILTQEQKEKLNDYDRVVKQKNAVLEKLEDLITREEYNEFIEVNNKIK